jgi:competence protein ComEC
MTATTKPFNSAQRENDLSSLFRIPPLLLPLSLFIAGIAAAGSGGLFLPHVLLPVSLFTPLPFLFIRSRPLFTASLCLTLFVVGNLLIQPILQENPETTRFLEDNVARHLLIEGVIVKRPEARKGGYRIVLKPERITQALPSGGTLKTDGLLLVRIGTGGGSFASGDRISFQAKLKIPRNFGTPGEFDMERFCHLKGIVASAYIRSDADTRTLGQAAGFGFRRHFDRTAAEIGSFIMARLPGAEGGIVKALLIGDTADIPQQLKDQYSRSGVNHILSISGFHIGIIALALLQIWFAISRLFPPLLLNLNFRRCALLVSIPLVVYYMFLSGAAPATERSVIMLCLLAAGLLIEREPDPVNSLALAAFALLLLNPANLYNISFQFSFLALWGLTVVTPLLLAICRVKTSGWRYNLMLFAAASTAAVTVTLLPAAYYFQQASLTGIISNFFIVPLLGYGAVVTGFAALPFIWLFPPLAGQLFYLAGILTKVANHLIALLAEIPVLPVFIPSKMEIALLLAVMLLLTVVRSIPVKSAAFLTVPLSLLLLQQMPAAENNIALRIDFLSVGQGESTLIRFADGESMLIDGGGTFHESGWDVGRHLLLPALRRMGIKRIDYLVLTHDHPDHLQGVKSVAETLPVGEFWESGLNSGAEYRQLKDILARRGVPVKIVNSTTTSKAIADTQIRCLYPLGGDISASNANENSLTLRLDSGGFSALFTGDIGFAAEAELLQSRVNLQATLLKVPHHGSRYSTGPDFLDAVSPQIATISAGYNNSFGLPAAETVAQLAAKKIAIYRTDRDGTITVKLAKNAAKPVISVFKRQI